jgi:hypothetical protein
VSSGRFDDTYTAGIMNTRLDHLSHEDRKVLETLATQLNDPKNREKNRIFAEIGTVTDTTDTWDPFLHVSNGIDYAMIFYESVWKQVQEMRTSRGLFALGTHIFTAPL